MRALAAILSPAGILVAGLAVADAPAPVPAKPRVIALVSAVGDQFTYIRQRQQVGTNLPPYGRLTVTVAGDEINAAVLRGLDKAVAESEPGSERVFLKLRHEEMTGIAAADRERVAIGKLAKALETFPDRQKWDRIIAVTPTYVFPPHRGMGSKLHGIGVYIQPLVGARPSDFGGAFPGLDLMADEDTVTPKGKPSRSSVYVAPFSYTKIWIIDAKTLEVVESDKRFDHRKLYDPEWTAVDVGKNLPPAEMANEILQFAERSSARAVRETLGVVTVSDPKPVP